MSAPIDPDELQRLWRSAPAADEPERWEIAGLERQLDGDSRSMAAHLGRRLGADAAGKGLLGALALIAAWIGRGELLTLVLSVFWAVVALSLSAWQWWARRRLGGGGAVHNLRDALARQLEQLYGIRLPLTAALGATPSLTVIVYFLFYFPAEYGGFGGLRSAHWLEAVVGPLAVFALSVFVTLSRLDLWSIQLRGALQTFDEETAAAYARQEQQTRRRVAFAVVLLGLFLLGGLVVWLRLTR